MLHAKKKIESEKTLERALKNLVEIKMHGWCLKLLAQHISGLPDRICLLPGGIIFFVEVKTTGKPARAIQLWVHAKLRGLGFKVYIVDCTADIQDLENRYYGNT